MLTEELQEMIRSTIQEVLAEYTQDEDEDEMEAASVEDDEEEVNEQMGDEEELPVEEVPAEAAAQATAVILDAVQDAVQDVAAEMSNEAPLEDEEELPPMESRLEARLRKLENRLALEASDRALEATLTASRLPAEFAGIIRDQFKGRQYRQSEVDAMVKRVREAVAQVDPSGRATGAGNGRGTGRVSVGLTGQEQAEIDFLRLVAGESKFRALESYEDEYTRRRMQTPAFRSWVKASRPRTNTRRMSELTYSLFGGDPLLDHVREAATTSSMTSIVKNTLNLLLAASYSERHQWWTPIVKQEEVETIDDATLVRVYGLSTLEVVDEGQAYNELAWADEEETASFVKKGNFVSVTLETLMRDKLNMVRTIPDRLANSWYNTISALVSGVFTVNSAAGPVLADTGALFNATALTSAGGHANLLTTAFSHDAFTAVRSAMMKQTDQALGAGQRLLTTPKYVLGPVDIETAVLQVRNSEFRPGTGDNEVNVHRGTFEFVPVPDWTDTDNWAAVADPNVRPCIWLIFPRGHAVPELFTADSEVAGAMFTNDAMRFKARMLTYRFSSSYECAPVGDWRGLHKSNV
jgi:hypothetical protein